MSFCNELQTVISKLEDPYSVDISQEWVMQGIFNWIDQLPNQPVVLLDIDLLLQLKNMYVEIDNSTDRDDIKLISQKLFLENEDECELIQAMMKACVHKMWDKLYDIELMEGNITYNLDTRFEDSIELYQNLIKNLNEN